MVNHPDDVQAILLTHQRSFVRSGGPPRLGKLLGQGLLRSQGEVHQRQRRLAQPAFNPAALDRYGDIMAEEAARFFSNLRPGVPCDFHRQMTQLTLLIVTRVFFSIDARAEVADIGRAVQTAILTLDRGRSPLSEWVRRGRFQRACTRLESTLYELIAERRRELSTRDLLGVLVASRDVEGDGGQMADGELRDELMTLLLAGHETTASALAWAGYLLALHPPWQEILYDEITAVVEGRLPKSSDLSRLPNVRGTFAEALRLYPPAWILFRRALREMKIRGVTLPEGSHVLLSPYVMGRDARFYPSPERFDPSRWTPDAEARRPKGAFFPFGLGNRRCLGEAFAWNEGMILLAVLLQNFRLRLPPGTHVEEHPLFTLRPKRGLPINVMARAKLSSQTKQSRGGLSPKYTFKT
jgi:cytochrome P450